MSDLMCVGYVFCPLARPLGKPRVLKFTIKMQVLHRKLSLDTVSARCIAFPDLPDTTSSYHEPEGTYHGEHEVPKAL
jgi:hypothetical protein